MNWGRILEEIIKEKFINQLVQQIILLVMPSKKTKNMRNVMQLKKLYFRTILYIVISLFFSNSGYGQQCNKKLTEVTLYKIPIFKLYYNGLDISDVVEIVDLNHGDTTVTKSTIYEVSAISAIDSLISQNKCIRSYLCNEKKCANVVSSMDIRHVFALKYSDSTIIYIGISSVQKFMMLNEDVYKRDRKLIAALYKYFYNQRTLKYVDYK